MRILKELLPVQRKIEQRSVIDEKTVLYVCRLVIRQEYGERGVESVIPVSYRDNKVYLSPQSSLWANEIWLQKDILCTHINAELGIEGSVTSILIAR